MPLLNIAENLKVGTMQVLRVMNRLEQVWPPLLCVTFTDDFERPLLGPTWTDGPVFDFGVYIPQIENAIDAGAYVAGENDAPTPITVLGTIRTVDRYPGDQFVEATVGNFFQGHDPCLDELYQRVEGEMWLFTQIASDSNACLGVYVIIQVNQGPGNTGGCYMQIISVAPDGTRDYFGDGTFFPLIDWQTNPNYTIRLETTAAGHCKALFEGRVVVEDDVVPIGGPHVGLAQQWNRTNYGPAPPITFTDEFDRADGPIGPDWIAVTENPNFDWVEMPLSIQSGAAIGVDGTGSLPDEFSGGMWHTEMSGDQYIEVCVTGLEYDSTYPIGQRKNGQIRLFCQANTTDPAKEELWIQWSDDAAVGGQRRLDCYPVLPDGNYHDESTFFQSLSPWAPALSDPTACIRLEALADGTRRVYFTLGTTGAVDLVGEGMAPLNNVGPYVGFRMYWWRATGEGGTSPRVLWARGGELAPSGCEVCDDFERADGPIGADWTVHTAPGAGETMTIQSGAAVAPLDLLSSVVYWHEDFTGREQSIEIEVENAIGNYGWFTIHTNLDGATYKSYQVEIDFQDNESELWINLHRFDPTTGSVTLATAGPLAYPAEPIRFGLRSEVGGRQVVTLNSAVLIDEIDPTPLVGPYVGMEMDPHSPQTSPRILSACIHQDSAPNTGTSPRFEAVTGGQLCLEPCGECIPDVMGAPAWEGLVGGSEFCNDGGIGPKPLAYDAAGGFYYQTCDNMAGNIWPEMVMPPVSIEANFGNIGNDPTATPGMPNITDYCSLELWRRDNFQYGDGLRVVIQIWDTGFRYLGDVHGGAQGNPANYDAYPEGWYWWIEWYEDVVSHDYIYEFYPDDSVVGRPGLGGDEFAVRLEVNAVGEIIFSVDGVEYHRATVDPALLPTGPGRFGFWMDRGSGGFVTVPPPDDAPTGSAVCMSLNPCT